MANVTESEYGTDSVAVNRVTDGNMHMEQFAEFNARVPTNALARIYYPIFIPQATQAVGTYVVGICPFACTLVDVKHICKTVTAAGTVEVESSSSGSCMTADDAANTLQSATLASAVADRLFDQGDSILVKIATASADLLHLCVLLTLQPIW